MTDACYNSSKIPSWYVSALQQIANVSKIPKGTAMSAAEALPTIKTPLFAVNQMMPTWDAQCQFEGQPSGNILQVPTPGNRSAIQILQLISPRVLDLLYDRDVPA